MNLQRKVRERQKYHEFSLTFLNITVSQIAPNDKILAPGLIQA